MKSSSTQHVPTPHAFHQREVNDLVESYVGESDRFSTRWLVKLKLDQPRKDTRCLGERTRLLKRISDIVIASTMMILLAPVMFIVALLIKLTSPGDVIFQQTRVGLNQRRRTEDRRNGTHLRSDPPEGIERRTPHSCRRKGFAYGKPFVLYKFRTMRIDAEKNGAQFSKKGDPRVTKLGKFLRRTRIDELPQLWNVLQGEMSMVGPRPERPEFIETLSKEIPNYVQRLGLKPGLTGVAQVVNGYDNNIESFRRKVVFDLLYLQNCCLYNDGKILLRTIWVVISGKGAL